MQSFRERDEVPSLAQVEVAFGDEAISTNPWKRVAIEQALVRMFGLDAMLDRIYPARTLKDETG
ncbi:hypothetical protein P0D69_33635 [Paraburkholderia sediminicola]|uniref:hypothetical protein n=1 Tax=Paraburkholderia sediminicola TaxID=458836 RepID=UPI0038BB7510